MRFTSVKLKNWRNFVDIESTLRQRVFLIGPNAAGKSNYLDVFRFLHDIVSVGGGFQAAVARRGGLSLLRSLAARGQPAVSVEVSVGDDINPNQWTYHLQFSSRDDQTIVIQETVLDSEGKQLVSRPDSEDKDDPERLRQTWLEQLQVNRDFRQLAEFFRSVRYLHIIPQLVREPDRSIGRRNDPFGGDFLEQLASSEPRIVKKRLGQILDALRFAVPQLKEIRLLRDKKKGTPHLRGKYEHWRPQGAWQDENQFSDGTLRLVGLLWAVLDGEGPLLLEEPELSLHSEVTRYIPQVFARIQKSRQILLSTHSPTLLQDEGIGLDEIILLEPGKEGTVVRPANTINEISLLMEGGLSLPEAVLPRTRPQDAEQLGLFAN